MKKLAMILAKDGLERKNFQKFVERLHESECWVISANPSIAESFNFTYIPPQGLSVSMRVALSINAFLKQKNIEDYDWLLKIDADMVVPPDYFNNLPSGGVYGQGSMMAIHRDFFLIELKGKYPINECDDGYIGALAESEGKLTYVYVPGPYVRSKKRALAGGVESFKLGTPWWIFIVHMRTNFRDNLNGLIGWVWAWSKNLNKYHFANQYKRAITRRVLKKIFWFIAL